MADNEAAVPKFGEWNDRDATAPDNYTAIFNKVREERQEASIRAPTMSQSNVNSTTNQDHEHSQKKCCCFPWPRKL